jgi:hypothetical protein
MAVQTGSYTVSMVARANQLVSESYKWTRARRKSDGLALVIFPSSKPGRTYYASQIGCTCPGYLHRGACSHVLALLTEATKAQEAAARPTKRYEDYWGNDDAF